MNADWARRHLVVATVVGGGLLLGVSAVSLDLGRTWWECRQLQTTAGLAPGGARCTTGIVEDALRPPVVPPVDHARTSSR